MTGAEGDASLPDYTSRPPAWMWGLLLFALLGSAAGTWLFVRSGEPLLWRGTGGVLTLLFAVGLADALTARLTLAGGELVVRSNFRTRRIELAGVETVHRDATGITLLFADGGRFDLPGWAEGGMGMQNRIRARVRRARSAGAAS